MAHAIFVKGRAGIGTASGSGDAPYVMDGERRERMNKRSFESVMFSKRARRVGFVIGLLMWLALMFMMVTQLIDKVSRHETSWQDRTATYEQAISLRPSERD